MPALRPELERLGDSALLLRWPGSASTATSEAVGALTQRLSAERPLWLIDVVPAYCSIAVLVDLELGADPLADAETWVANLLERPTAGRAPLQARTVELPVCYDPEFGLDLSAITESTGLSIAEVIARHSAPDYRVAMLGFAPGFPYLLGLDPRLSMPRLATPRRLVAAGSVGIGGSQTGVYPGAGPGGWRLLGRTPLSLFDPQRIPPTLLLSGDRLRFVPVSRGAFDALGG